MRRRAVGALHRASAAAVITVAFSCSKCMFSVNILCAIRLLILLKRKDKLIVILLLNESED